MDHRRDAVAAEIRAERARQNIPIKDLAASAGISTDTLRRRLAGNRPFYFDELDAIAVRFGMPLSELLSRAEDAA